MIKDEYSIVCEECKNYNISPVKCEKCWKKEERDGFIKLIDELCETESWTNHDNPVHVIGVDRLKRLIKSKISGGKTDTFQLQ